MKLFTVGPVEMHPRTLDVASKQVPYFRTMEFSEIMKDSERLLKETAGASDDSETVFLTASGTGAMEATVINCLTPDDRVLIVVGGGFGRRFSEICDIHGIPHDDIVLDFGQALTGGDLSAFDGKGHSAILVNLDETSTGQLYDLGMISDFCRRNGTLLIVDAISSFLADDIRFDDMGIDALILSSQKALALSPGISAVVVSRRMCDRCMNIDPHSLYFDFKPYFKDMERGQTPFTPAVGILLELNDMLHMISENGVDSFVRHTADLADYFRRGLKEIGLGCPDYPLSNAVTPIVFENGGARRVFETLKDDYGLMLTPNGGDLADRILRVGHIGNHTEEDYRVLLDALKEVMQ